jgi:hypothetical protein
LLTGLIAPGYCQDRAVSALGTTALATLPSWTPTGNLNTARSGHTATLLPNGKVLVVGGIGTYPQGALDTAELYDPTTATWSFTGHMNAAKSGHTATLLPDGRVLVVGEASSTTDGAELYDPSTGTWSLTSNSAGDWRDHTATLLRTGKVLVAGGWVQDFIYRSAAVYDPAAGSWSRTGSLITGREASHQATLLQDGRVLVTGGTRDPDFAFGLPYAELYDPGAGTWSSAPDLHVPRLGHSATLLPNGKVLVAGGDSLQSYPNDPYRIGTPSPPNNSAELFDPATGNWSSTGSLNAGRSGHTATLLPNGEILVVGGYSYTPSGDWWAGIIKSAERYDASAALWRNTSDLSVARIGHTATLLPNGQVLVAGGINAGGALSSAELYVDVALPATVPLIEYFNAAFGDYFITSFPDEISKLDNGTIPGWVRTGFRFDAYAGPNENSVPVCRFFSTAFAPKAAHFYTPFPGECAAVQMSHQWTLESAAAFYLPVPAGDGSCAAGFTPVYRLYNNSQGGVPIHRYTTDPSVRAQMIGKGWVPEGIGPNAVEMCSPL